MDTRYKGKIIRWVDDKGYGFITPDGDSHQVFFHITAILNRHRRPIENELVTYKLKTDSHGRLQADSVELVADKATIAPIWRSNTFLAFAVFLLLFIVYVVSSGKLPTAVLWLYLLVSIFTFIGYALDKIAAENDKWRIQETTLHLLAVAGGWPGALAAQRLLRHKSRKQSFQVVFKVTVALNCSVLGWYLLFPSSFADALRLILGTP